MTSGPSENTQLLKSFTGYIFPHVQQIQATLRIFACAKLSASSSSSLFPLFAVCSLQYVIWMEESQPCLL